MPSDCTTVTNNRQFLSQRNAAWGLDWIGKFMSHVLHLLIFLQVKNTYKLQWVGYQVNTSFTCSSPAKNLTGGEQRSAFWGIFSDDMQSCPCKRRSRWIDTTSWISRWTLLWQSFYWCFRRFVQRESKDVQGAVQWCKRCTSLSSDLQRSLHSAGHRSWQIRQPAPQSKLRELRPKGSRSMLCAGDGQEYVCRDFMSAVTLCQWRP